MSLMARSRADVSDVWLCKHTTHDCIDRSRTLLKAVRMGSAEEDGSGPEGGWLSEPVEGDSLDV